MELPSFPPSKATDSSRAMMIQEAATYNFDGSCCCYKNDEETVASGPTLSIARRFGCCCFFHSDHTIVKMEKVSTTRIEKPVDGCALFIAWLFAGCFGWHRFASGRYKSGFAMAIVFTLAFAGVVGFFIAAEDELWNHDWHHPEGYRPHWIDLYTSLTVAGILCAIVFGLVVCLWIFDAFFLLRWSHHKVHVKTRGGDETTFRIAPHQDTSLRQDLEEQYRNL